MCLPRLGEAVAEVRVVEEEAGVHEVEEEAGVCVVEEANGEISSHSIISWAPPEAEPSAQRLHRTGTRTRP